MSSDPLFIYTAAPPRREVRQGLRFRVVGRYGTRIVTGTEVVDYIRVRKYDMFAATHTDGYEPEVIETGEEKVTFYPMREQAHPRSKYNAHQGARECARRVAQ